MHRWQVPAGCIYCGEPLTYVNGTRASATLAIAVIRCEPCGREYELTARLTERRRTTRTQRRLKAVS